MAEEGFEERTEEASQQRRDEWKRDGQVSQSRELNSAILLLAVTGSLYGASRWALGGVWNLFETSFENIGKNAHGNWTPETVMGMFSYVFKVVFYVVAPIAGTAMAVGILTSIAQTGFVWTGKPIEPNIEKLDPMKGIQRIFSIEGVFELGKAVVKFVVIGAILYPLMKKWIGASAGAWELEASGLAVFMGRQLTGVLFAAGLGMFVLAALDFGFQKFRFEQRIKMTKQEVREERKSHDGNPQIRARIRQLQRQVSQRRMVEAVKKADVVVTNPTHIAVALVYDRENMMAPRVVAKGADHMAERIKKIARENGIPTVENVPLARALYKALKIGQFISRDLYNAVAEVLAYVYRLKGKSL